MEDKTEDSDVFEIVDFTTASDWERFTSRLEEIIHEWKLTTIGSYEQPVKAELGAEALTEITEEVSFADFPFLATYCSVGRPRSSGQQQQQQQQQQHEDTPARSDDMPGVLLDLMNPANDFPSKTHCLTRWYGLRNFVVLSPKAYAVTNESRINMLLSSVAMAINNSGCQVPIFVQVHEKWRRLYLGHFECSGLRTMFEMVHLKHVPPKYSHLSGLVELFKAKLNTAVYPHPRVNVVIRLTYSLSEWPDGYSGGGGQASTGDHDGGDGSSSRAGEPLVLQQRRRQTPEQRQLLQLPFGACDDPVSELYLAATWPDVDDDIITESEVYSDLDPLEAPVWSVRVKMADEPQCLLSMYLAELSRLCGSDESSEQALGRPVAGSPDDEPVAHISTALERLTEPHVPINIDVSSALHKVVSNTASQLQKRGANTPIPETDLNLILEHLFPDAKECNSEAGSGSGNVWCRPAQLPKDGEAYDPKDVFSQYKTAPADSLLAKLAVCLCVANYRFGGVRAVAHLWQEFVLEMRYRWESGHLVPGLEHGSPNLRHGILYQKIQMLNCCIDRKIAREQAAQRAQNSSVKAGAGEAVFGVGGGSSASLQSSSSDIDRNGGSGGGRSHLESTGGSEDASVSHGAVARTVSASSIASTGSAADVSQRHSSRGSIGSDLKPAVGTTCTSAEDEGNDSDEFFECDEGHMLATGRDRAAAATDESTEACQPEVDGGGSPASVQVEATSACSPGPEDASKSIIDAVQEHAGAAEITDRPQPAPEGRLRRCGELKLIGVPGEALYIPHTQEPAPMTEDLLAEHAEVLTRLGTTAEGASLRARMQSASLLSDMESFKAANPGCLLEDFVRWYSPRDFIVDAGAKNGGALSERMLVPGNMWAEVWNSARPVPARRQRRLFDDTREAEKVLHYLAALKPGQVALHALPLVVQAAVVRLKKESHVTASVRPIVDGLALKAGQLSRQAEQTASLYSEALHQIRVAEVTIARAQSLCAKFPARSTVGDVTVDVTGEAGDLASFARQLLEQPEVTIVGGAKTPAGAAVAAIFRAAAKQQQAHSEPSPHGGTVTRHQGEGRDAPGSAARGAQQAEQQKLHLFGNPAAKEYIMRAMAPCPAPCSRTSPQRLYCTLLSNETRLAGAFTHDTTFL